MIVANYDDANILDIEFIQKEGLYKGVFTKAFLFYKQAVQGNNTWARFYFTSEENFVAEFDLFLFKNGSSEYEKDGYKGKYLGFRQFNAIMIALGISSFHIKNARKGYENIFNTNYEVFYFDDALNKKLVLGLGIQELDTRRGVIKKVFLDRVFFDTFTSIREKRGNLNPKDYLNYIPVYKALNEVPKHQTTKVLFDNKGKDKEKYVDIKYDEETNLPF